MAKSSNKSEMVVTHIRNQIANNHWPIYSKLPTENELANQLNVSRVTVRKALQILKGEGIIESRQGSGAYVSDKTQKSLIPVILSHTDDSSRLIEIYRGIQDFFSHTSFKPLLLLRDEGSFNEEKILSEYQYKGFSNLLIYPFSSTLNMDFYNKMISRNTNIVFIDTRPENINCNYVGSCNFLGGYLATKHLIEKGHQKIAFCCHTALNKRNTLLERFNGYKQALLESHIPFNKELVFERKCDSNDIFAKEFLSLNLDVTAVFCGADDMAIALMKQISESRKKITVMGFDNLPASESYSLSTINQNFYELGRSAAEMLYERIINPHKPYENRYIPVDLIIRDSTKN